MVYGYARVSTRGQGLHGTSLQDQTEKLKKAGAEVIVSDTFTGKTLERPQLAALLPKLQDGDTLLVCKLDRLSRTAADGAKLIDELNGRGVLVQILNFPILATRGENGAINRLMTSIVLAFAEFEHATIVERCQEGRERTGHKGGRPAEYKKPQKQHALELLEAGRSYREVEELTGMSKSTLIRMKRKAAADEAAKEMEDMS